MKQNLPTFNKNPYNVYHSAASNQNLANSNVNNNSNNYIINNTNLNNTDVNSNLKKVSNRKKVYINEELLNIKSNNMKVVDDKFEMDLSNSLLEDVEEKKSPVLVKCKVIFSRMGTINTIMERFDCQAFIECSWEDDKILESILDELQLINKRGFVYSSNQIHERVVAHLKTIKYDPAKYWSPKLYIENAIGEVKEDKFYKLELEAKERPLSSVSSTMSNRSKETQVTVDHRRNTQHDYKSSVDFFSKYTIRVYEMKFIKGVFYERLELYDFPLDMQELSITVTSQLASHEVQFIENKSDPSGISTSVFLNQQEWDLFDYVRCQDKLIHDTFKKCVRAGFSVSSFIARKPGYYINNAYTLIFLITVLGFVPFSVDVMQPNARSSVAGVLILTQVNFRWIITQRIPSVPYLTSIDKYAIGNLLFLVLFACWHSIVGSQIFDDLQKSERQDIDTYVLIAFAGVFIIYTLFYIIMLYRMQLQIRRKKNSKIIGLQ